MVQNERAFLREISQSTPEELIERVSHADTQEERLLRIYLGSSQFDQIRSIGARTRGPGQAVSGNVVVLHGIMGGELTLFNNDGQSLIWVQAFRLLQGQFDRLTIAPSGLSLRDVRATGIYMRYYGSLLASLSQQWNVRPFFFDWRRDISIAADELNQSLNTWFGPDQPVNLVAHSMGGLVARSFISRHPDRWAKGGRLVMLGTPNYGSFAISRLLSGTNDVLALVSKIDFSHNALDLLNIAKTFPGAYQMLPVRGHLEGLDPLYRAATYTRTSVDQALIDQAVTFQASIANAIDTVRMIYVAGYNRPTLAGLQDPTQLAVDSGYFFSRKGDGTVPHNLGLLPGVRTFYVDEEHMNLPGNGKVQKALTELLQTGNLQTEDFLYKGLGPEFANERGLGGENQNEMLSAQSARMAVKEQQALALRNLLASRGDITGETVSAEEQALADVILRYDPLPLAIGGQGDAGTGALIGNVPEMPGLQAPAMSSSPSGAAITPPPHAMIRTHVISGRIEQVAANAIDNEIPIDCIAVGHYTGVRPTGSENDLDKAISPFFRNQLAGAMNPDSDENRILAAFHDRGLLRGDLGVPFVLPDPRPDHPGGSIVIGGMGSPGAFGVPELSLLARELTWSLSLLGKRHLATVLIGAGKKNLSYADAVHGWLAGLNQALASCAGSGENVLQSITFVVPFSQTGENRALASVVIALQREAHTLANDPRANFEVQLIDMPVVSAPVYTEPRMQAANRISINFEDGVCRYSAMTDNATIPERVFRVPPKRIADLNSRLLSTVDPNEKYRLGRFLLDFLFPRDLRSQLSGNAPVVLACNNEAAKVYWELAAQPFEDEDQMLLGDQPYLGLARGLTRQLRTILAPPPEPPPPAGRILRVLIVADACREHPLPGARQEAQALLDLFDRYNASALSNKVVAKALVGPSRATTLDVLLNINDHPAFDVLHYAGHCVYDREHPERSGFLFSDDDRLTAEDLDRVDRTPKFVFSNACESGVLPSRPDLSSPELPATFAEAFFKKGVANFICTAWPIGDLPSRDFAAELYTNLLGLGVPASPMYESLRKARQRIADTNTWGAYQHYGNPYFRLFRSTSQTR